MKPILGKAGRPASPARAALAFAGLAVAVLSALPAVADDLGTLPAALVRRFSLPLVREVIGGEKGGREFTLAADVDDRVDFTAYPKWVWWSRRPDRRSWSFFRVDQGWFINWPGKMMAVERASPETMYFVDDAWILRRSTDGGETWTERGRTPVGAEPVRLQAGERPGVLFLFTNDPYALFRSTDGGLTWKNLGSIADLIVTLAFTPDDPDLVIGYAPGAIVRSRDGGATFTDISPGRWVGADDLAVAPSDASIVYALGPPPFLRRSRNGGTTWRPLGPPVAGMVGLALAVDPRRPNHLVVLAVARDEYEEESGNPRAFESFDGGLHWRTGGSVPADRLRFVVDEQGLRLEAFGRRGLHESRDGGATWRLADDGITADHDLLLAPASDGKTIYLTEEKDGELWRSTDGGKTWERKWRFSDSVNQLLVSPSDPDRLVASVNALDLAGCCRLWWSEDAGASWNEIPRPGKEFEETDPVSVYWLSFHPVLRDGLYAGSSSDAWRTVDRGRTWERLTAMLPSSEECSDTTGSCWEIRSASPVLPDPLLPARLYTFYLSEWMRSDDSGRTWAPLPGQTYSLNLIPDPHVRDRIYLSTAENAQVFVRDRAGDGPSRLLFSSPGTTAPYRTWMILDGEGNLLLQPDEKANVFFRQREQGGWDRFSLRLPSAEITGLFAGPRLPGGGSVLFVVQRGIGLWRVELPGP